MQFFLSILHCVKTLGQWGHRLCRTLVFGVACGACLPGYALAAGAQLRGVTPEFAALLNRCAPTVHPETMAAVVSAESRGNQFAIADAGPVRMPWAQRKALVRSYYLDSLDAAVAKANGLIAEGHTVSMGMAQVNDRNLARLGISIRQIFDACTNLSAGSRILSDFYARASKQFGPGERALHASISAYNSGDWVRGERDGYVSRVYAQVGRSLDVRTAIVVPRLAAVAPVQEKHVDRTRIFALTATDFVVPQ